MSTNEEKLAGPNFIEAIIIEDNKTGKHQGRVHTRFPPEPNGYLHIGHAKAICLNFGLAQTFNGLTNLRFDDTNPVKEDTEYVDSIKEDIRWLGFNWEDREYYASDYFGQLYDYAVALIKKGKAYVDHSTAEEMRKMRGIPTIAGQESPFRNRDVDENLSLFEQMKNGELDEGSCVLRAKIDMTSPNMHMRDPVMYRILKAHHHRTGNTWSIYPMYDYAHGICDAIERITHSCCTLEFENHRPLYDWFLDELDIFHPQQIEFARLNLNYTIMSKRKLLQLVEQGLVSGWDDPRMPTISGLRRRGYTPQSIRNFAEKIGVAKRNNIIDVGLLESCVRDDLNKNAARIMAIVDPIKVIITNYDLESEQILIENNPEKPETGSREVTFSNELYIEQDDFMENPPKGYFRLSPGGMVRLKGAFIIQCDDVIKNQNDEVTALKCSIVANSKSGSDTSGIKVKGVIHWLSVKEAVTAEVRFYDRLFAIENPAEEEDFTLSINPNSLTVKTVYVEPVMKQMPIGTQIQFVRKGYFCIDKESTSQKLVINQVVGLKDSWAKAKP